jgi:hypothetical protein
MEPLYHKEKIQERLKPVFLSVDFPEKWISSRLLTVTSGQENRIFVRLTACI